MPGELRLRQISISQVSSWTTTTLQQSPTFAVNNLTWVLCYASKRIGIHSRHVHLSHSFDVRIEPPAWYNHGESKGIATSWPRRCSHQHSWLRCYCPAGPQQNWFRCWQHDVSLPFVIRYLPRSHVLVQQGAYMDAVSPQFYQSTAVC